MSVENGPGEGTWSVFAMKVAEQRDALQFENSTLRKQIAGKGLINKRYHFVGSGSEAGGNELHTLDFEHAEGVIIELSPSYADVVSLTQTLRDMNLGDSTFFQNAGWCICTSGKTL